MSASQKSKIDPLRDKILINLGPFERFFPKFLSIFPNFFFIFFQILADFHQICCRNFLEIVTIWVFERKTCGFWTLSETKL